MGHHQARATRLDIFMKFFKVLFPFHGEQLFFGVVAFLAAGRHIAFGAFTAAGNGHDVVHGQIFGRKRPAAVMANPLGQAALPPLRFAQRTGLVTLPFLIVCAQIVGIGLNGRFAFHFSLNREIVDWKNS